MVQRYYHANQAAMRVVAAALDNPPRACKATEVQAEGHGSEIVTRQPQPRGAGIVYTFHQQSRRRNELTSRS